MSAHRVVGHGVRRLLVESDVAVAPGKDAHVVVADLDEVSDTDQGVTLGSDTRLISRDDGLDDLDAASVHGHDSDFVVLEAAAPNEGE